MLMFISAKSQSSKWRAGRFIDVKGNIESGFIRVDPSAKGPVPGEGFIEFKEDNKANPFKLSAGDLKCFVAGRDSFVVAHAPGNEQWGNKELDFVRVALNEDIKLYVAQSGKGGRGGGRGIGIAPEAGVGLGTGGYGGGIGGGISIPIGGGGGGRGGYEKTAYYFGTNTADMKRLTNENFEDTMVDIMGDYPDVADKIHAKVYILANVERLLAYYKQVRDADTSKPKS